MVLEQLAIYMGKNKKHKTKNFNSYTIQKFNSKWILVQNTKAKTIKLVGVIKREIFVTLGECVQAVLDRTLENKQ